MHAMSTNAAPRSLTQSSAAIRYQSLANGLMVVTERIDGVASLGVQWLLPVGCARDPDDKQGLSAMLEELLLRGAGDLDSRAQADAFDRLGVSRSTGTGTYHSTVSATMLGARLVEALPLVVDMVRRPHFDAGWLAKHFEPARDLCVQAIESLADEPQSRVGHELKRRHAAPPLNRSDLGTIEGLEAIEAGDIAPHWAKCAAPGGSILALAGDVDHDAVVRQLEELLGDWSGDAGEVSVSGAPERGGHHINQESSQVHIAMAQDGPSEKDPDCWFERMTHAVLSGGMSGRLFTEVREKRSLCYSVSASYTASRDFGRSVAYSGTTPERAQETLDVLRGELERIATPAGAVTADELRRAKIGLKSRTVMAGESTSARAGALARDMWKLGRPRTLDEITDAIEGVELEALNAYLARRSLSERTIVTIGPGALGG
ncbi:MAG: insulinase family protein [Phycisphaerales bacterium]|nr:insulinase family protein [Phycisphaerales bacterium]